jgi:hypothetical protein
MIIEVKLIINYRLHLSDGTSQVITMMTDKVEKAMVSIFQQSAAMGANTLNLYYRVMSRFQSMV